MRNGAAEKLLGITSSTGLSITDDAFAAYVDEQDPLREHRDSFNIPKNRDGEPYAYMVAHTLGLQHVGVEAAMQGCLRKWQQQAVEGNYMQPNPWFEIDKTLKKDMASLIGASASEVAVMNSHTVNLHMMMAAFYRPTSTRRKIMMESQGFPSNTHALVSQLEVHSYDPSTDLITLAAPGHEEWDATPAPVSTESILAAIDRHGDETAVLVLGAVHFLTGQFFDVPAIVAAAHAKGIVVGLDCSHAVGNVPLQLHDWEVDFATWCTYKYLSGGPGNVGAAFVHSKHTLPGSAVTYLKGWWGHDRQTRFSLRRTFDPEEGAGAFQVSSSNVMGITCLTPSLRLIASVGVGALRDKSQHLTAYLELLLGELVPPGCVEVVTPANPAARGAQLSIRIRPNKLKSDAADTEAYECGTSGADGNCDAEVAQRQLLDLGVMVDNRPPDILRITPAPLYNSYADVLLVARAVSSLF
uniref:Kynureninase n=1 Tax=Herpetomonas muscarum TaxID=5718 RepID=T1YTG3_HERMU|nr:kynureninase [Herpetomonas muscarum]